MHAHPLDARIARLEGSFDQVNERLGSIDRRLDSFEHAVALRFDRSEQLTNLRFDQIDRRFNWLTGIVVGTWITTILAVLFHR
jgi:tetrahydromethanopterin S-methyltransferase subunit G